MTLELKGVSKTVGRDVHIADVSLTLEPGSINVLLGPTLSGKTSLMRLMAGLDAPSAGRVLVNGEDVTGLPVRRRSVAMVYQQFINYPNLSVYENIASPLRVAGAPKAAIETKVREAARLMKLERELSRTPLELSGGQQQRTAIARALVKGAGLVLLDEPLANLDYKLREELREELPRIFGESGAIFVYATTEPSEALLIGGHTAALSEGRITQFGSTVEVYRAPENLITAQTFSDPPLNTLPVEKKGAKVLLETGESFAAGGTLSGLADGAYVLGIRPNHLQLEKSGANAVRLDGEIAVTEITGSESFVHADAAGRRWVAIVHAVLDLQIGAPVSLFLDPTRFFVFDPSGALVSAPGLQRAA